MKKVVRIKNLDCANCAAALERAVAKIDGVNSVNVSFIGEKMTLDYDEDRRKKTRTRLGIYRFIILRK